MIFLSFLESDNGFFLDRTTTEEQRTLGLLSLVVDDEFVVDEEFGSSINTETKLEVTVLIGLVVTLRLLAVVCIRVFVW